MKSLYNGMKFIIQLTGFSHELILYIYTSILLLVTTSEMVLTF